MTVQEFTTLYQQCKGRLYTRAVFLCGHKEDAEDLLQDTVTSAISHLSSFTNDNFYGWLYTILQHNFINFARRKNKVEVSIIDGLDFGYENTPDDDLQEIISMLPQICREPFVLSLRGFKYKEISQMLDIPIGTVKSRINLARTKLRDYYNKHCV